MAPNVKQGSTYVEGPYSFNASAVITRGHAVDVSSNVKEVTEITSQGAKSYGVAIASAKAGEEVAVLRRGRFAKAVAGAAIALNAQVTPGTGGKYETALTADVVAGWARTAPAADGDEFLLELDTAERAAA